MRTQVGKVTTKGGAGAAIGTEEVGIQPSELTAIELRYAEGAAVGTTVKITCNGQTLLEVTSATPKVYYVRKQSHTIKGEEIVAGEGKWNPPVVNGHLKIEVSAANAATDSVVVTFFLQSP